MSIKYNVLQDGPVLFFKDDSKVPFLIQTAWPNGQKWNNIKDMYDWAKLKALELEDEDALFAPLGPDEDGKPKPNSTDLENAIKAVQEAENFTDYTAAQKALQDLYS